jgi:hypothetical protein
MKDSITIGLGQSLVDKLSNSVAQKYLRFGFNLRALQINECHHQLRGLIEQSGGLKIDPYTITHINIFINSFYINLLGATDNLAWILQHELNLIDGASEKNRGKFDIGLFQKKFIKYLKVIDEPIGCIIQGFEKWHTEIKDFRDPAAHRIPLYCPPGVMFDNHLDEHKAVSSKLADINYTENSAQYMTTLSEQYNIGEYQPIFTSFQEEGDDLYFHLLKTVEHDYTPFWLLSHTVLSWLEAQINNT